MEPRWTDRGENVMVDTSAVDAQKAHASVQLARDSFSRIVGSPYPGHTAALEAFRRRNAALDAVFYDVGKITPAEAGDLAPWLASEGALLIVSPSSNKSIQLCADLDRFAECGGKAVRIVAVSGVGSSALGAAAFARNIADALGEPVAALVSGYGLSDLLTEAMGGWFYFRLLNGLRHQFEALDAMFHFGLDDVARGNLQASDTPLNLARSSRDTRVLAGLLSDPRFDIQLLAGHSKGNMVISEALYNLGATRPQHLDPDMTIVTVSAIIGMPGRFRKVIDVIGWWDWLGAVNSNPWLWAERRIPQAGHHTNTALSGELDVTAIFQELVASGTIALRSREIAAN